MPNGFSPQRPYWGDDRELRARMGWRHGILMEIVGDVVAQLPLMLYFQRR